MPVLTVANSPSNPAAFIVTEVNAGDTAYRVLDPGDVLIAFAR